jgi:putative ABC transport system permease protein
VGRWLSADEILNDQPVAVISDDLWRTMGGDQSVLNRPLRIEDRLYTVVGVMPPQFGFPNRTKVWRPLAMRPDSGDTPSTTTVAVLGKLRPGVSRAAARRELSALSRRLGGLDPTFARDSVVMRDDMIDRRLRPTAVLMVVTGLGAGLCVLMIVCTSVATLMVARTAERRTEMAVRASLGAGRWRLTRQLLAESLVLSLVAGLLGTLVSVLGVRLVLALVPTRGFPSWLRFGVDARVLAFTIVVTMLVTVLVSTLPVRVATRLDLVSALKNGTSGGGRSSALVLGSRRGLIVQLALSMALFMGTVLMARSYHRVATFDFGYPAERIVSVAPTFDWQRYPTYTSRVELLETVAARVREQSGIATIGVWAPSVTLATRATVDAMAKSPALRREPLWNLRADSGSGRTIPVGSFHVAAIPDHYFDILGVHLVQGRPFSTVDAVGSVPAAIISRTVARTIFGNRNPLGRQLSQSPAGDRFTVVGVAEDVRRPTDAARRAGASNDVYLSIRQTGPGSPELLAQGADVDATKRLLAAALRSADPQLPVPLPQTLDRAADEGLLVTRLFGTGLGFFAASGLLLSIIGIYGVVAFAVTQRTREIGIRLALGGSSSAVVRLLLREGLRFTVPGVVIGLALAAATARVMQRFLIETSAFDPLAYVSAALFFALISTAACYLPGRRAARVDPLVALRSE